MPGIGGIIDLQGTVDIKKSVHRMAALLKHRSWYTTDLYWKKPLGLVRVGLGIVNPEPQPIFNEDRKILAVMDGEIYGSGEIKKSLCERGHRFWIDNDLEFILHRYEEDGVRALTTLNGTFNLALWDNRTEKLILVNDRHGLKPFYYHLKNGVLMFASELKAILKATPHSPSLDERSVAEFFTLNQLLGTKTFFKDFHLLKPASILEFEQGRVTLRQYWDYEYKEEYSDKNESDYVLEAKEILVQAVNRRLAEKDTGLLLSGGLDSRTIFASIPEGSSPLHTYTFGIKGCPDELYAAQLARIGKSTHRFLELRPSDLIRAGEQWVWITDGMCNLLHFTGVEFFDEIRHETPILLLGLGGGEYFGESFTNPLTFLIRNRQLLNTYFFKSVNLLFRQTEQASLFRDSFFRKIHGVVFDEVCQSLARAQARHPANIIHSFYLREFLPRFIAMGMVIDGSWVVVRTPFFDNDFIDFLLRLPPQYRLFSRLERRLLTLLSPAMAQVPWQRTGFPPAAPTRFVAATALSRKLGIKVPFLTPAQPIRSFHDYDQWFRTSLRPFIERILLDKKTLAREYFKPGAINEILTRHMSGARNFSLKLGALLTFELWHRRFLDG